MPSGSFFWFFLLLHWPLLHLYFANAKEGRIEWSYTVPPSEGSLSGLAVGLDGRVYIGSQLNLYVVDGSDGVPHTTVLYKMGVVGIPTISNHGRNVYFQGTDNYTYSVDTMLGALEWKTYYGGGISSSAISPDCHIVLGYNSSLYYFSLFFEHFVKSFSLSS